MSNSYKANYEHKSGRLKRKEKEKRELEKCKTDKKQKKLGDFFNQFESASIKLPEASPNVDKQSLLSKSVSNKSSSPIHCKSDSSEIFNISLNMFRIHQVTFH